MKRTQLPLPSDYPKLEHEPRPIDDQKNKNLYEKGETSQPKTEKQNRHQNEGLEDLPALSRTKGERLINLGGEAKSSQDSEL